MSANHINIMGFIRVSQDMEGFHAGQKNKTKHEFRCWCSNAIEGPF